MSMSSAPEPSIWPWTAAVPSWQRNKVPDAKTAPERGAVFVCKHAGGLVASAPRGERTAIGNRELVVTGAQVLVRIHRNHVEAYLVVKVRPGGAPRLAHVSDDLSARHMLARHDDHRRKVPVHGEHVVTVVDGDFTSVAVAHTGSHHIAI